MQITNKSRLTRATLLVAFSLNGALPVSTAIPSAMAHEADCPHCQMPVTQNTPTQDNEVALKFGRKRIEYKCVYCALAEAKTEFAKGDLTISTPSEKKGKPVMLKRTGGKWAAMPATAYFVSPQRIKHKVCQQQARSFTTKTAAQAHAKKNGGAVVTLAQMVAMAK